MMCDFMRGAGILGVMQVALPLVALAFIPPFRETVNLPLSMGISHSSKVFRRYH
jgi:hypothetical protein